MKYFWVWLILSLLGLVCVYVALRLLERHRRSRLAQFVAFDLAPKLLPGWDESRRKPLLWLTLLGFGMLGLALAQPHWGRAWEKVRRQSRDVVVCLDVSPSMLASNPLPTRIDHAKQKILALADRMPGDRFALVAFAGAAKMQCPLTLDRGYFRAILRATDSDSISMRGTDIAQAIEEAMHTFAEDEETSGNYGREHRAILVITDGEQVSGDVLKAAEKAAAGATVYVIGVGDPNGTEVVIPSIYNRVVKQQDVQTTHVSKLDEDTLIKVATYGGGRYVRSQPDNWDIEQIVDHVTSLATRSVDGDVRFQLVNRYQWPLFFAILCIGLEGLWLVLLPYLRNRSERSLALVESAAQEKSLA
jgi:Ca-activated chloride channel family protein